MTLDVRKPSSLSFRKLKVLAEGVHDRQGVNRGKKLHKLINVGFGTNRQGINTETNK